MIEYKLKLLTPVQADRLKSAEAYVYSDDGLLREIIQIKSTDRGHWHWNSETIYKRVERDLSEAMIDLCHGTSYPVTFNTARFVASSMAGVGNVLHKAWKDFIAEDIEARRSDYLTEGWTLIHIARHKRDRELL